MVLTDWRKFEAQRTRDTRLNVMVPRDLQPIVPEICFNRGKAMSFFFQLKSFVLINHVNCA